MTPPQALGLDRSAVPCPRAGSEQYLDSVGQQPRGEPAELHAENALVEHPLAPDAAPCTTTVRDGLIVASRNPQP